MYAAGLATMVLHKMADVADTLENRVFRNMDMQDVRMNEVEREVELAKDEIVNNHDELLQAQVDIGDLRYRNRTLEDRVLRLEEQVRDLMAFRTVLQHGPGNPIVVEDTGCTEGFSDVENYEENGYKMTNSLTVFYALKIVENLKFSCNFLVLAFHKLRKF